MGGDDIGLMLGLLGLGVWLLIIVFVVFIVRSIRSSRR